MNITWLNGPTSGFHVLLLSCLKLSPLLAQIDIRPTTTPANDIVQTVTRDLGTSLPNLVRAIVILVVGWLLSLLIAAFVRRLLKRTQIDNRLANWISGRPTAAEAPPVEKWISGAVFWLLFIFTIVAFLQALQLTAVSEPLNNFLNQVIGYLPSLAGALALLAIAWLLATLVKLVVTRSLQAFKIDERLGQQLEPPPSTDAAVPPPSATGEASLPTDQFLLSETIGNTLYWFIFLLFLPSVLNTLGLQGTLQPIQGLLNSILSIIPNVLAALLISAAGWLIAQVVRRIVTNLLAAAGVDRIGARFGLAQTPSTRSLSWIIGTLVFVLILIPTAISALNALRIEAISGPAINMLNQILNALPQIFTAILILIVAYVIGQFLAELVTNILTGLGFNNIFYWLGLKSEPYTISPPEVPPAQPEGAMPEQPEPSRAVPTKTPSEVVGIVVWIGVMLFAAIAAINILNIEALTAVFTGITVIFGRIIAGLIVFAIGLYLANLAFNLIASSGGRQARILGQTARIAIIVLVSAMALQQIGVASDIINLAFGLLLGAIAVAIALAFGLGGRDIAAEQIREWLASFKRGDMER
ncbi:mechanosensitive ion channel [Leptothermofonsia sp. ETS-13]|uniref:mechanosensitive ion channel n=1 Tax=Leptothermofonsia sp. ETS-13 TaxID=3035696 RepID=UPI003BA0199E